MRLISTWWPLAFGALCGLILGPAMRAIWGNTDSEVWLYQRILVRAAPLLVGMHVTMRRLETGGRATTTPIKLKELISLTWPPLAGLLLSVLLALGYQAAVAKAVMFHTAIKGVLLILVLTPFVVGFSFHSARLERRLKGPPRMRKGSNP